MMRNRVQCIVPPHVLEAIEANGTPEQRAWAAATLSVDATVRADRAEAPTAPPHPAADLTAHRRVYDAGNTTSLPGTLVRGEGDPASADVSVNEVYDGFSTTLDLYNQVYSRNSIDDAGLDLIGTVHYSTDFNNAMWDGGQAIFGDGDGDIFNRFTIAVDVIGHELTHGVTQYTAALAYRNQSGALNESMSDVFGSLVKQYHAFPRQTAEQADWLIGAGLWAPRIRGAALRSMKAPGTAYEDPLVGKDPQPATMDGYVTTRQDNGGVHINSGIPNHAFYLAALNFGGYAWEKAGRVWYSALTDRSLSSNAGFLDFARLTVQKAEALFGSGGRQRIHDAWARVGIST
ncbi:thermolysin metallopeptidase-like protein [Krasilnikovia cinnamomea]|uniref:Neutral metalloproteinase n=1 Tax=Krasilnikovia cinnamomea TaxID=349313 RepID=A0A4Q7ZLQ4_9ACTN|nr:M4 family metallopeptidase [Krasilnikovia cinnamomea]RZU51898.1 thermolysin metallopeptidase-like protein [Krasilnikovia cinnamomea]